MAQYIQFQTPPERERPAQSRVALMIEVEASETPPGIAKAGLKDSAGKVVAQAATLLDDAIRGVVSATAEAFYNAVQSIEDPPKEIEVSFGLKITGEVGNIAISKAGAAANFNVKLVWKDHVPKKAGTK